MKSHYHCLERRRGQSCAACFHFYQYHRFLRYHKLWTSHLWQWVDAVEFQEQNPPLIVQNLWIFLHKFFWHLIVQRCSLDVLHAVHVANSCHKFCIHCRFIKRKKLRWKNKIRELKTSILADAAKTVRRDVINHNFLNFAQEVISGFDMENDVSRQFSDRELEQIFTG